MDHFLGYPSYNEWKGSFDFTRSRESVLFSSAADFAARFTLSINLYNSTFQSEVDALRREVFR